MDPVERLRTFRRERSGGLLLLELAFRPGLARVQFRSRDSVEPIRPVTPLGRWPVLHRFVVPAEPDATHGGLPHKNRVVRPVRPQHPSFHIHQRHIIMEDADGIE